MELQSAGKALNNVMLQHGLGGAARPTFKNSARRGGFNVWRLLVLKVNSQTECRRFGLRDRVQMPPQAVDNMQLEKAIADWETLYSEYRDAEGPEMDYEDRLSQLLRILPLQLRKDVFKKLAEFNNIDGLQEWIRAQTEL